MNTGFKQKRKKWPWVFLFIFIFFFAGSFYVYSFVKNLTPDKLLQSEFVQKQIVKKIGEDNAEIVNLIPEFLGFHEPKTYLFLFLNNTELRPGGGFIGSYATLKFTQGKMDILQMGGSEDMDTATSEINPPQIIKDKLVVDRWYFRDSNWSPDFVSSSEKALQFYKNGNNVGANEISGVIGVTTDVLEDLMKITGPFTVEGIDFTASNVVEKLEYEVEYGFDDRGLDAHSRKDIMETFMLSLLNHLKTDFFQNMDIYKDLAITLLKEKNVVLYSLSPDWQKTLEKADFAGRMKASSGDYLMWVDANLSALKTDWAIRRNLQYSLRQDEKKDYIAKATMNYLHQGKFDWRTTYYLSYARVYVPVGAQLISANFAGQNIEKLKIDSGLENGRQWFGTYISVEPGANKSLSFEYKLPEIVTNLLETNNYNLLLQKQIGMNNIYFTTDLQFAKNISTALPAEEEKNWGDSRYKFETDLTTDFEFKVKF
ncbi:MAG: hypothetical protein ACD_18C00205G0002 [uncultured bacterium]|nr:MAG: hypothetical protein ACD_18C00205G0002 [uncultured bacterium]